MGVNYREQYKAEHLEPFFPNEIAKMVIVVLCTLAVLMLLVVLPVFLQNLGVAGIASEEQPADPRTTPPHIRPEWYFLAVYQYLKLMPQEVLGMNGKSLGMFTQMIVMAMLLFLPFWYPLRPAKLEPGRWGRGLAVFLLMLAGFGGAAGLLVWIRGHQTSSSRDLIHPMFAWPVLGIAAYVVAGWSARKVGVTDAFKWLKLFTTGFFLIVVQYLAFIVVLRQSLHGIMGTTPAYLIGMVCFVITSAIIVRFLIRRIRGDDERARTRLLLGIVTEGIIAFLGLTVWAMLPPRAPDGSLHEVRPFVLALVIIVGALVIFYAFLLTERRTINKTLTAEEKDRLT